MKATELAICHQHKFCQKPPNTHILNYGMETRITKKIKLDKEHNNCAKGNLTSVDGCSGSKQNVRNVPYSAKPTSPWTYAFSPRTMWIS